MKAFTDYLNETHEEGIVEEIIHSIIYVSGLPGATLTEMVMFESGQVGQVMAVRRDHVEVLMLTRVTIDVGTKAARTGFPMQIQVSQSLLGGVIDSLGRGVEGYAKPISAESEMRPIDSTPLGVDRRSKITKSFDTGVVIVDLMIPLGMGQRELILGDRKTGKSYITRQSVIQQAKQGNLCVYALIGKKKSEIKKTIEYFKRAKVLDQMVIVASGSHDSVGEIHITPYSAMCVAEYFRDSGRDVLVVLDDMTTHAKFYRELSLLARKFPGRDSYPGDIFHIHSKLLERSGNFMIGDRAVSITCLPIAEVTGGDMTGYIQTNLMSMTDGHIFFDGSLYSAGRRPAINPFLSVTRVGHQTQNQLRRDLNQKLFDLLNDYEKTQGFLRFGAELGENSRQVLAMGEKTIKFFDQPMNLSVSVGLSLVMMSLLWAGVWDGNGADKIITAYEANAGIKSLYDSKLTQAKNWQDLVDSARNDAENLLKPIQ
jgi:F-type H+/Na+-transporting ATPase subunit alpha